jgi:hypothetical protein
MSGFMKSVHPTGFPNWKPICPRKADLMNKSLLPGWYSWPVLAVLVFVTLIHVAWWITGDQIVARGGLADGDSFLRLLRVERLIETGNWFDISIPDANAPFGMTLHWTRLFDLVLLALAFPMAPFMGFAKALYWAGVIVSPLLHILSAGALAWALIPVLGRVGACLAGALCASQAGMLAFSLAGRADHHMMFVLLAVLALGFVFRVLNNPEINLKSARLAGLFLALGIWEGPENLVYMSLCLAGVGLPWLAGQSGFGRKNLGVAQGLILGLLVALVIERGMSGVFDIEYDRISIIHLSFALLLGVFWTVVTNIKPERIEGLTPLGRMGIATLGLSIMVLVMILLFPKILGNPLNDADAAIQPIYERISEYRATFGIDRLLIYFGSFLFVGPWLIWKLKSQWGKVSFWAWALLTAMTLVYVIFGLNWLRWSMYSALFLVIVLSDLVLTVDHKINLRYRFPLRVGIKAVVIVGLIVGPMFTGALILNAQKTDAEHEAAKTETCPVGDLSAVLNQQPWSKRSRIVAASANFGAEIIYRTDHQVLATVHHRNVSGILDGHRILNLTDEDTIKSLIQKRQVDLIVLCPGSSDDSYFLMGDNPGAFYLRLKSSDIPSWITQVKLPAQLEAKFDLFEIRHPL